MEFKRIPFIAVQRKFNLTDRQMYYIRDRIRKYHKEDEWFIFEYNAIGEKELWISHRKRRGRQSSSFFAPIGTYFRLLF